MKISHRVKLKINKLYVQQITVIKNVHIFENHSKFNNKKLYRRFGQMFYLRRYTDGR